MTKIPLLVIVLVLVLSVNSNADVIVSGVKTVYVNGGNKLTEGPTSPANPAINDLWRDTDNDLLFKWSGSAWVVKRKTASVEQYINTFKSELSQVTDPHAKEALKMLGKAVLWLYNETLP